MRQSTLKPQFRMRCFRCDAYSAQSYRSAAQSVLCHHCHVYIGTPPCKMCQSEDTQAHQPKSGRWQCNTCGGTFTYRSMPTRAEKRRQAKDLHPPQKPQETVIVSKSNHDDVEELTDDSTISVCDSPPICLSVTAPNFSVSGLNDELRTLIRIAGECASNRNMEFPIHDFQNKLQQVLNASDDMVNRGLMSSKDLASAAEEALFGCYFIELTQTLVRLVDSCAELSELLTMIGNAASVRATVGANILNLIERSDIMESSDVDSGSEHCTANTGELAICHLTNDNQCYEDEDDACDIDWKWYPSESQRTKVMSGFAIRLLN